MMNDKIAYEPYDRILQESLKGELRLLNGYLPSESKSLADLLHEEHPHVACSDGSVHLFKKKEPNYLASLLDADERKALLLPILIEIGSGDEIAVICRTEVEKKVVSKILDMPVTTNLKRITIYGRQLSLLRKVLKTTTQYVFSSIIRA